MGGGSDKDQTEAPPGGALVAAVAWIVFGAIIIATVVVSALAFRDLRDNYRALSQTFGDFREQVRDIDAGFEAQGTIASSPPIHPDGPPQPPVTWHDEDGALVTNPDWLERPSGQDLARYYPSAAAVLGVQGRAVIECRVDVEGRLHDCVVTEETPEGMGFGAATVNIARHFRMTPQLRDGEPVDGARIRVPIAWRMG